MSRRGVTFAVVGAVVVAGVALAATGVLPNPFSFPPPEVVESGSDEARAAGEMTMPPPASASDPFAPNLPIVESGSPEARALAGEEIEKFGVPPNPFDLPPIPVVESGTEDAWIAHGETFIDLAEEERLAEMRRQVEATFAANSRFPPNPESEMGSYRFDLMIRQLIDSSEGLGEITYFVNSADNSQLFLPGLMGNWMPGGGNFAQGEVHFAVRQADGDTFICGKHQEIGPACLLLGDDLGSAFGWFRDMSLHRDFLASIPRTPQTLGEGPGGNVQGIRGKGDGIMLQMWVSRRPSSIATQMPFLGAGVGVFKDTRIRANRLVHRTRWEGGDLDGGDLVFDLVEIGPAEQSVDSSDYRFVTAFTGQGLVEAMTFGNQLPAWQGEARAIQEALDACPSGRAGSDCRKFNRQRMKELNERVRDQALDYGRRHGLPVDDE
ncbi:hypothetical protein [Arenimonas caeni]|uniref:Uncharacterized protein n=1 Tax=Arenimonas caeni TaxID=2058085 RepID=A0A2P6M7F6_9GAMM|nr:hypothetical protein [Arenimonas caeni]PRH81933.1 hypothetical protein C6N40_10095 [Arenimonas caeni]